MKKAWCLLLGVVLLGLSPAARPTADSLRSTASFTLEAAPLRPWPTPPAPTEPPPRPPLPATGETPNWLLVWLGLGVLGGLGLVRQKGDRDAA